MVLNYIWISFFLIAFIVGIIRLIFFGDTDVMPAIMNSTFETSKTAFEISLGLTGVLSLWMGVMKIGEKGGVVQALARILSPARRWFILSRWQREVSGLCNPKGMYLKNSSPKFRKITP